MKAEAQPTNGATRESGLATANGCCLRRFVRHPAIVKNLKRNGRDYCSASGEKVICLYFTMTRFRVRSTRIEMRIASRKFTRSKRIELVRESNTYWWMDKTRRLTLHDGLQAILRKLDAKKSIHIRIAARMPNDKLTP